MRRASRSRAISQHLPIRRTHVRGSRRAAQSDQTHAPTARLASQARSSFATASAQSIKGPTARVTGMESVLIHTAAAPTPTMDGWIWGVGDPCSASLFLPGTSEAIA